MQKYDSQMAARVWQRVQSGGTQDDLEALIRRVQMDGAVYAQLARQLGGRLKMLSEAKTAQAACLKGIHVMATGRKPEIAPAVPPKVSPQIGLRRCLAGELYTLEQYERLASDGCFSPIFAQLAQEQKKHCKIVAELIGKSDG